MGGDMRFVKRRGMQNVLHTFHRALYKVTIEDRSNMGGARPGVDVDADELTTGGSKCPYQCFAKVARASSYERFHLQGP